MKLISTVTLILACSFAFTQTTRIVRPGQFNVPITEVQFDYDNTTYTQTSEASGTNVNTNKAVDLKYVKVNDNGTIKLLDNFNFQGAKIINNNFSTSVSGVGVYNEGTSVYANNQTSWEDAMITSSNSSNVLNYLFYDGSNNVPSGADFDIIWTKGFESTDYYLVGERNGNTCFALTPLDSTGAVITTAYKLQFGNCNGTNRAEYEWNIGYAPSNYSNQPMVFTVVSMSAFNTDKTIFGFRIDNTGNADPKFCGISGETFLNNPNNPLIGGLSGNVFNDANGLVNSTVDGDGIYNPSSTSLYATLINSSNVVVSTVAIGTDGSYEFLNLEADTYKVLVSTTAGTVGSSAPSITLPTNWEHTGEFVGSGTGSDGTVDGILSSITINANFVENVNFGIQKLPESIDKSQQISVPSLGSTQSLVPANSYPALEGIDSEDGALGVSHALVITDTSSMNGNELYYDGNRVTLNSVIPNFDSSLLTVKFVGENSTSFAFDYYFEDAAGSADETPATYTIGWSEPLPVDWLDFYLQLNDQANAIDIHWSTAQELNNSHFLLLRASDGVDFEEIGSVQGKGTYMGTSAYHFTDYSITPGKKYFYKVVQVDYDGKTSETNTLGLALENSSKHHIAYPNPFVNQLIIDIQNDHVEYISVQDLTGKIMYQSDMTELLIPIRVSTTEWPSGIYFLTVSSGIAQETIKVVKH